MPTDKPNTFSPGNITAAKERGGLGATGYPRLSQTRRFLGFDRKVARHASQEVERLQFSPPRSRVRGVLKAQRLVEGKGRNEREGTSGTITRRNF